MKKISKLKYLLIILTLVFSLVVGCRHNTNVANPTTPFQQVMLWNQGLSQTNQDIEKAVKGMNATNPPVIDTETTRKILTAQFKVAKADKALTQILEQGPTYASGKATEINDLLTDIQNASTDLTNTGTVGIKNAQKQQEISAYVQALGGLAKTIVVGLQAAGVIK